MVQFERARSAEGDALNEGISELGNAAAGDDYGDIAEGRTTVTGGTLTADGGTLFIGGGLTNLGTVEAFGWGSLVSIEHSSRRSSTQ